MTNLPPSNSEAASTAFDRLHPSVQKWIWKQGWSSLREIQEKAAGPVLDHDNDVIITAATAGGKTEAAFLPVISRCASADEGSGFSVLYISPLKALINDQARRLEQLCEMAEMGMTPWHGDVGQSVKNKALKKPHGVLLITPESLEAMFLLRGGKIKHLFGQLEYVIIDELHAFIGSERGIHLLSLLCRLENVLGRSVVRVGLSATLGDMNIAAGALRTNATRLPTIVNDGSGGAELKLQIRGYEAKAEQSEPDDEEPAWEIEDHLFKTLRGSSNLVFAKSRQRVEVVADRLRCMSEGQVVPNEFYPHHGNLSKDLREDLEARLKDGSLPTTAVATTTLELGIDIGDVKSVAQIGAPNSLSGLRQRLGRSGRREGIPSILRIYTEEARLTSKSSPIDQLRQDTIMSVAAVRLLVQKWCETPPTGALHLSTLVHQSLAVIKQHGGMSAAGLFNQLCVKGAFQNVSQNLFISVLKQMGSAEAKFLEQADDGTLLLGEIGERIADQYDFYAVFQTPEEYRVESGGKVLGQVSADAYYAQDQYLIFAGKRWKILDIDSDAKVIRVEPARGGVVPVFDPTGGEEISDQLVQEMRSVYLDNMPIAYCDDTAKRFVDEARIAFQDLGLARSNILAGEKNTYLFPWAGSRYQSTLTHWLNTYDSIYACIEGTAIRINASYDEAIDILTDMKDTGEPDAFSLAQKIKMKESQKFHRFLNDGLLSEEISRDWLKTDGLMGVLKSLC